MYSPSLVLRILQLFRLVWQQGTVPQYLKDASYHSPAQAQRLSSGLQQSPWYIIAVNCRKTTSQNPPQPTHETPRARPPT